MLTNCCPKFCQEKPILTPYYPQYLSSLQKTGDWYGVLSLAGLRGFITIINSKVNFWVDSKSIWDCDSNETLKDMSNLFPNKTVLDVVYFGGSFILQDILYLKNCKLDNMSCASRRDILTSFFNTNINLKIKKQFYTDFWLHEIELLNKDESSLAKKTALNFGIPYQEFLKEVDGIIVRNKKSYLTFPEKTKFLGSSFFRIKKTQH
jgi:hypothetical protein